MAFFNEFKEKFNKAAQSVTSKTKDGVEFSRLAGEGRSLSNEITALYEKIGRIYVESSGTGYEALAPLCSQVHELKEKLEEIERQKMQIRNQNRCPACGAAMPKNARFCSSCGRRMPENTAEDKPAPSMADISYCKNCGAMLKNEDEYCSVCGHGRCAEDKPAPKVITRPIVIENEDSSDEAPSDFEAE